MIALRHGRAVAEAADGRAVGVHDALMQRRALALEPRQQRRAEVEGDVLVVVDEVGQAALPVHHAGLGVGAVALAGDARVPVVVAAGGGLALDLARPRVLARRLVEVAVDAGVALHQGH
jgi:hypothetical protein